MRVLVVEDDPVLLNGLEVGLGMAGYTVEAVSTCADASRPASMRHAACHAVSLIASLLM